jgi:hypothetical protein
MTQCDRLLSATADNSSAPAFHIGPPDRHLAASLSYQTATTVHMTRPSFQLVRRD